MANAEGFAETNQWGEPVVPSERDALLRLCAQAVAGVWLAEQILDRKEPGWDAEQKGRRRRSTHDGPGGAAGFVRSALHTVWLNSASMLTDEQGVAPWRIPPLAMRTDGGRYNLWQWGPDGMDEIVTVDTWDHEEPADADRDPDQSPVRPVRSGVKPQDRLYTLEQARAILGACVEHTWVVETSETGAPTGVRCARPGCGERRDVA